MDDNQKMNKTEMLARANQAVKEAAVEFTESLKERVGDMEKALHLNDLKKVVALAYNLETEASTFGWPRITRLCKWLRKIFSGDYDNKPKAEDVMKVLGALKLMASDPETSNDQRDEDLFRELYPMMSHVISDI